MTRQKFGSYLLKFWTTDFKDIGKSFVPWQFFRTFIFGQLTNINYIL